MQVKAFFFIFLLSSLFMESLLEADFSYRVENSNFSIEANEPYNYNRLRLRLDYTNEGYFATFIGDGVNYYGDDFVNSAYFALLKEQSADTPISTQSDYRAYNGGEAYAKVYRAYGGYEDESNRIVFGLQNITMGVGRIWTPTNLFNPRNTYAIEPDEIFGVLALSYTRYLSSTSQLTVVASQKADDSYKYALRYKAYLDIADFAINLVASDKTKMLGYELEGNLAQSGVELRSEGAYIKSRLKKSLYEEKDIGYFQGILGADYAFVNGLTLSAEGLYSSKSFSYGEILLNYNSEILPNLVTENFYAALSGVYSFNIYLDGSLVYIDGFHGDESRFISPSLTYTMNDYNSFMLGALLQKDTDRYYLKWTLSF